MTEALVRGQGRGGGKAPPPEAETRLAFRRSIEATNFPGF